MDNSESTSSQRERDPRDRDRISSFEQMKVWQEAHALVLRIFEITPPIPPGNKEGSPPLREKPATKAPKPMAEASNAAASPTKAPTSNLSQSAPQSLRSLLA